MRSLDDQTLELMATKAYRLCSNLGAQTPRWHHSTSALNQTWQFTSRGHHHGSLSVTLIYQIKFSLHRYAGIFLEVTTVNFSDNWRTPDKPWLTAIGLIHSAVQAIADLARSKVVVTGNILRDSLSLSKAITDLSLPRAKAKTDYQNWVYKTFPHTEMTIRPSPSGWWIKLIPSHN